MKTLENFWKNHKVLIVVITVYLLIMLCGVVFVLSNRSNNTFNSDKQSTDTSTDTTDTSTNSTSNTDEDTQYKNYNSGTSYVDGSVVASTTVSVKDIASTIKNVSSEELTGLNDQINITVSSNAANKGNVTGEIREGSYKQEYNASTSVYTTTFMLDIPKLKQSYYVTDLYSPLPQSQSKLYDYTQLVQCPTKDQLKYGEFKCTDRIKDERGEQ